MYPALYTQHSKNVIYCYLLNSVLQSCVFCFSLNFIESHNDDQAPFLSFFFGPCSTLTRFHSQLPFTTQTSVLLVAKLLCWSSRTSGGSAQKEKEADCRLKKKKECIVQVTRVFSFSTFVRQNVIRWNCACRMTLHFKLFHGSIFPSCSPRKKPGQSRQAGEWGGNSSLTVLLCVTAVLIANLQRHGRSQRGMKEDRKQVEARERLKERDYKPSG